jgi:hypothetical protein
LLLATLHLWGNAHIAGFSLARHGPAI